MKIGFVQFKPALGDLDTTIATLDALIDETVAADLLVLPELANSGYFFESKQKAVSLSAPVGKSKYICFIRSKCAALGLHIVTGFNERDGDDIYNSAVLVGPGGVVGTYRKLHLFMNEKDHFAPGNLGLPVFDIGLARVGMAVCFDWMFPEVFRILALRGADIICHPSNLVLSYAQQAVPVHALTNHVYIVTANRTGTEDNLHFTGNSIVAGPKGEVLASASVAKNEVRTIDVDIAKARNKAITPRNHALEDRRPEEYVALAKPRGQNGT